MSPRPSRIAPAGPLLALLLAGVAGGQIRPAPPDIPAGLEPEPVRVESMGLTIHPPSGSVAHVRRIDGRTSLSILDGAAGPAWSVAVQPLLPTDGPAGGTTPRAYVADILSTFRRGDAAFRVLDDRPATLGGKPGHLCYVAHEAAPDREIVSGWLILDRGESELLVFASQILPEAFDRIRPLLDSCYETIRLDPLADVALSRKARLEAGRDLIASITPDRLRGLAGPLRWYRYYRPAAVTGGADAELGYYSVECREGPKGGIDPSRSPSRYDRAEEMPGLLVIVRGHYLEHAAGSTYDTLAGYWVAWDQSEEAWSIRGTRRFRGREQSEAETGIRTPQSPGDPSGTVTVIASGKDGATRDEQSWRTPDVYLSQALRWNLGAALPRDLLVSRTMSTYAFDSTAPRMTIALRTDRWEPRTDGSGGWMLTSRTRTDAAETVTLYDRDGTLVRRRHADGAETEAIALEDLHRLWKSKGLPTGRIGE